MSSAERVLDTSGPAAPPRSNGELIFGAPWEGRVFGLTMALYEQDRFAWDEFRQRLIAAIARAEAELGAGEPYHYYACWLEALTRLLAAKGMCAADELAERESNLAARPAGHDH